MDLRHVSSHVVLRCRACDHGPTVAPLLGLPVRCDGCGDLHDPRHQVWFTPPMSKAMALRAAAQWHRRLRRPLGTWPVAELRRLHRLAIDNDWQAPAVTNHLLQRMRRVT